MRIRRLFFSVLCVLCLCVLVVIAQLLYPTGRLLPFVRINGETYGGQTITAAASQLQGKFAAAHVEMQAGGADSLVPLEEVGLDVSTTTTALQAGKYSLGQRFIPFSSVMYMIRRDVPVAVRIDSERVHYFAEQFEQQSTISAVDAAVQVHGDQVRLSPAKPKQTFPADETFRAIMHARISPKIQIAPKPVITQANVSNADANELLAQAQAILGTPLTLHIGQTEVAADKPTVASWLDFPVVGGKMQLGFKTDVIKSYVESVQSSAYRAPVSTRITTLDGKQTGKAVGVAGQGVDIDGAAKQIEDHLRSLAGSALVLKTVALAPGTTYDRQYSDTSVGLGVLLGDLTAGKDYGVTVLELGGKARTANSSGDKVYLAASTYKLYVAYAVYQLIDNGEMHWSDTISGLSADTCFEKMIVNSDNACATAFGERVGWQRVEDMAHSVGVSGSTTLSAAAKYTTANDLALYLRKLQDGSLVSAAHQDQLISYMKRQIYRKGVPAGTGVPVADKVGFLGSVIHDPSIVYAPGNTYIMVIMTNGSSWASIASVAHDIHAYITR